MDEKPESFREIVMQLMENFLFIGLMIILLPFLWLYSKTIK